MTPAQRTVAAIAIFAVGGFVVWRVLVALAELATWVRHRRPRGLGIDRDPVGTLTAPAGVWTPLGVTGYEVRHDVTPTASVRWVSKTRRLIVASDACGELAICDFPGAPRFADVCGRRGHCMTVRRRTLVGQR